MTVNLTAVGSKDSARVHQPAPEAEERGGDLEGSSVDEGVDKPAKNCQADCRQQQLLLAYYRIVAVVRIQHQCSAGVPGALAGLCS